ARCGRWGWTGRGAEARWPWLLELGVVEEEHVVDPGLPVETVADAEDVGLLVRLDDGGLLVDELLGLPVDRLPPLRVVGCLRLLQHLVERLVLEDGQRGLRVRGAAEEIAVED